MTAAVLWVVPKGGELASAESLIVLPEGWAVQAVPQARGYFELGLDPAELPGWHEAEAVRKRGERLREALCAHPPLRRFFDLLCATAAPARRPLLLRLEAGVAETVPWEALCDLQGAFMALDPRWPIIRVSDPMDGQGPRPLPLRSPVKILALISARGVEHQHSEFAHLWDAVESARAAGLDVSLRVLSGDAGTRQAVEAAIAAGASALTLGAIAATPTDLLQDILDASPNVLHFFCHGHAGEEPGEQSLELTTIRGMLANDGSGTVRLSAARLVELVAAFPSTWLVTLNCCSGGAGTAELLSIAHQIVGAGGAACPAAVAMTEPVEASDAHRFARSFYRVLLRDIAAAAGRLAAPGAPSTTEFDPAPAMREARRALCEAYDDKPAVTRQWLLPVLYVRGTAPLLFARPAETDASLAHEYDQRARVVAEAVRQLRETLDRAGRAQIVRNALTQAQVPESFWPDPDGNFTH